MNIIAVPFHDWRKCQKEGFRTRDVHFIEHFLSHEAVEKVLVINRPITIAEMILKRTSWKTNAPVVYKTSNVQISQIHEKGYVIDFLSGQAVENVLMKHKWFFQAYGEKSFVNAVKAAIKFLGIEDHISISFNVFAAGLFAQLHSKQVIFDAFDNLLRFPHYEPILPHLNRCYQTYARVANFWLTNSEKNRIEFFERFKVNATLVKNGVDPIKFSTRYPVPSDMAPIKKPIIGFGGKITNLMDANLMNYLTEKNTHLNFVVIGQILNKPRFAELKQRPNLHYLGDKHYDVYPAYVANFDVCIMPFLVGDKEHGADAIKLYEYICTGNPVVSTSGTGARGVAQYINISDDYETFSTLINQSINQKRHVTLPTEHTWEYKANELIQRIGQVAASPV